MGNRNLVYKKKLSKIIDEIKIHLERIDDAFNELKVFSFPLSDDEFDRILSNKTYLAFTDQIIYRFSKAQDTMGAKLFKAYLLYEGENVDKPFLDILERFEKLKILDIDEWFIIREIRNEIAHEYEDEENRAKDILNAIFLHKDRLKNIIKEVENSL